MSSLTKKIPFVWIENGESYFASQCKWRFLDWHFLKSFKAKSFFYRGGNIPHWFSFFQNCPITFFLLIWTKCNWTSVHSKVGEILMSCASVRPLITLSDVMLAWCRIEWPKLTTFSEMTFKERVFHPDSRNGLIYTSWQILNYQGALKHRPFLKVL